MKPSRVKTFPAPAEPTYVCQDDEGNSFIYVGEDTFTRLRDGPEKDRWMEKLRENKVTISELAGCMTVNVETGETVLNISDDWEVDPIGELTE